MNRRIRNRSALILVLGALAVPCAGPAAAAEAHRGLYLGAGGNLLALEGDGTWGGRDFDVTGTMTIDADAPLGLNWAEHLTIGVAPTLGYRFGDRLAVESTLEYFFPKRSYESYTTTETVGTYEQALDFEWNQLGMDAVAMYYPAYSESSDWNVFLYAGVQRVRVDVKAVTSESLSGYWNFGDYDTVGKYVEFKTELDCWGALLGAGFEIPSGSLNLSTAVRIQYSTAHADQAFFGTPDFDVSLGGFSVYAGLRWYFTAE